MTLEAPDTESLLVAWLNELLYFTESDGQVFTEFGVNALTDTHIEAQATGGPATELNKQIKAVTFHNLKVERTDEGFETTIVFDV
ncbi:MAG: archease [Chloroflexi bacterium]|nr:archease [Chloroflexota bacterium]